jgi:hypothetical protein
MDRRFLVAVTAFGLVSGCAKPLTANDMPRPKAGLWTWIDTAGGVVQGTGRACLAGKPLHILGPACPAITYSQTSDGVFETENKCDNGAVSDFTDRFSGNFQSSYVRDQRGVLAIPGKPVSMQTSRITYTYVGPCPAGATPDDEDD